MVDLAMGKVEELDEGDLLGPTSGEVEGLNKRDMVGLGVRRVRNPDLPTDKTYQFVEVCCARCNAKIWLWLSAPPCCVFDFK